MADYVDSLIKLVGGSETSYGIATKNPLVISTYKEDDGSYTLHGYDGSAKKFLNSTRCHTIDDFVYPVKYDQCDVIKTPIGLYFTIYISTTPNNILDFKDSNYATLLHFRNLPSMYKPESDVASHILHYPCQVKYNGTWYRGVLQVSPNIGTSYDYDIALAVPEINDSVPTTQNIKISAQGLIPIWKGSTTEDVEK